ncbi:hypothetical protein AK830_g5491 [Neonectria ditissima]|uniref:Uncharacterized protein n=1 Tax=Neonectria ditissima TaxID=78410 RepID=A0A0P7BEA4_9HYPO|nr:hypothetical protein AK830_g5491 [Neonectria ditissima]
MPGLKVTPPIANCLLGRSGFMDLVLRFYETFDVLAALPAVIAAVVMAFDGLQDDLKTIFSHLAIGFLGGSIVTSVIALALNQQDLAQSELWIPGGLVNVSIAQLLGGLMFWSVDRYPAWVTLSIGIEALLLLLGTMALPSKTSSEMNKAQDDQAPADK